MTLMKAHPTVWEVVKLLAMTVLTTIVVGFVLRIERKITRKKLIEKKQINWLFIENAARFAVILLAVQWVVMSSPLTQPFGKVLFQGTAIIGAIAGFAAQPVIADLICGLIISTMKPFEIGDRIELEDGTAGIVKDITLRHVVLQTIDTVQLIIPNSKLNAMKLTNMSYHTTVRSVHLRFNVAYNTDVERAMAVIQSAVKESPYTIPGKLVNDAWEYAPVYFLSFSDSSLVMATTIYYEPKYPTEVVRSDVNTRVKRALEDSDIEIPYDYVNVVMREERAGQRR